MNRTITLLLLLASSLSAQTGLRGHADLRGKADVGRAAASPPITEVAHTGPFNGTGGGATATSAAINSTGASMLSLTVSDFSHDPSTDTVADFCSGVATTNVWTHTTSRGPDASSRSIGLWYSYQGSGAVALQVCTVHTIQVTGNYSEGVFRAFAATKTHATSPFDLESAGNVGACQLGTPLVLPSLTPSAMGGLVITAVGASPAGAQPLAVSSPFSSTLLTGFSSPGNVIGDAYVIQTTAVATTPGWNNAAADGEQCAALSAAFKAQ